MYYETDSSDDLLLLLALVVIVFVVMVIAAGWALYYIAGIFGFEHDAGIVDWFFAGIALFLVSIPFRMVVEVKKGE